MTISESLSLHGADMLLSRLMQLRMLLTVEECPTARTTMTLMLEEVTAELARRNDAVIARREAGAKALIDEANAILTRPR